MAPCSLADTACTKMGKKVMLKMWLQADICLADRTAILYSSTRIIGALLSHVRSIQQQCKTFEIVDVRIGV